MHEVKNMTNKNDVSIFIDKKGSANRAKIQGSKIFTTKSSTPTENKASITIECNADNAEIKGGEIYNSSDITQLKAEIQELLNKLAENPITAKESVAVEIIRGEINDNPTFKKRLISALEAGGIQALKAIFNHPAISIPVETIRGFLKAR